IIEINGHFLFGHAYNSLSNLIDKCSGKVKLSCVVRDNDEGHMIARNVKLQVLGFNCYTVPSLTRGAVDTCMSICDNIQDDDGVLVLDCDLSFTSKEFERTVEDELNKPAEEASNVLLSFTSNDSRYSYAEVDDNGIVIRTAEKKPISNHALAGAYFFASGKAFKQAASVALSIFKGEVYLSNLYNILISSGFNTRITQVESYNSNGTPEELLKNVVTNNDIKMIISDFDGTLVDTYEANLAAYKIAFEKNGLTLTDEMYASAFGLNYADFMEKLGVKDSALVERIHDDKAKQYAQCVNKIVMNKSLVDFIRKAKKNGAVCALATMSSRKCLDYAIKYLGIGNLFDTIITSDEIDDKYNMILDIMNKHNVSPSNTLLIEDSDFGCAAAQRAKCNFIKI
ncbi:MAG: HAD hydrolase-like protein, partial [Streptococcus gallolyticus]|nr:HAD hydrolase-like protein [Streptococcus gallolyticus]